MKRVETIFLLGLLGLFVALLFTQFSGDNAMTGQAAQPVDAVQTLSAPQADTPVPGASTAVDDAVEPNVDTGLNKAQVSGNQARETSTARQGEAGKPAARPTVQRQDEGMPEMTDAERQLIAEMRERTGCLGVSVALDKALATRDAEALDRVMHDAALNGCLQDDF